jgi:hypothetical protein
VRGTKHKHRYGVWEFGVYLGPDLSTGKGVQISKTFNGGFQEADSPPRDLVDTYAEGRPDGVGVAVGQFLDRWLQGREG